MNELTETFSVSEVAQTLGVSVSWLYIRCRASQIPHLRIARQYRFTAEQVDEILHEHMTQVAELPEPAPKPEPRVRRAKTTRTYPTCEAPNGG